VFGRRRRADGGQQQADALDDELLDEAGEPSSGRPGGSTRVDLTESEGDAPEPSGRYPTPPAPRPDGPWDESEVAADEEDGRIDLGGLRVPGIEGMELRVELAEDQIVAVTIILGQSAIQLQPFAAPRSEGIWREVRTEIAAGITQQGGIVDENEGSLGVELRAQVPVELPDGQRGVQAVRFVGCDGPRWFLRGVISGQAAVQPDAGAVLEGLFRNVVVVRGGAPMAPRDPIPLRLPEDAQMVGGPNPPEQPEGGRYSADGLNPFERGPEITEVR
jgi:hypothetical protein